MTLSRRASNVLRAIAAQHSAIISNRPAHAPSEGESTGMVEAVGLYCHQVGWAACATITGYLSRVGLIRPEGQHGTSHAIAP
jgi:hypothetical protein